MLTVVIGPPAAGKSTWCREHAGPDDIIIDYDLLALALSAPRDGESKHEHAKGVKAVTKAARQAAIDKAITLKDCDVYLIHSTPSAQLLSKYRRAGAEIVVVDPGYDIVMARVKELRPWRMQPVVKEWYERQGRPPVEATAEPTRELTQKEKGLGHEHRKNRARMLRALVDGTPCWWCGLPMYRAAERNHDELPLHADHSHARANGGVKADRLLHDRCNKTRQDGSRDNTTARPTYISPDMPAGNAMDW